MSEIESVPSEYGEWFISLKRQIRAAQQRAALAVNRELVQLYWNIGDNISTRYKQNGWGSKIIHRLADALKYEFPGMKVFSVTNLKYMRMLAESWSFEEISQAPLDQFLGLNPPWVRSGESPRCGRVCCGWRVAGRFARGHRWRIYPPRRREGFAPTPRVLFARRA